MIFETSDLPQTRHQARLRQRGCRDDLAEQIRLDRTRLTDSEKALALLVLEHNSTFAAIARASDLSRSTVCRRYYRIIAKLRPASAPRSGVARQNHHPAVPPQPPDPKPNRPQTQHQPLPRPQGTGQRRSPT